MEEKEFNGTLKEVILEMFRNDTDCCEVTNTVDDVAVTVEITITKIVEKGKVVYDAYDESADSLEDDTDTFEPDGLLS